MEGKVLDRIPQNLAGTQPPWVNSVPARLRHRFCHHVFMSVKNHSKFEVNMRAKESKRFDLLPGKLWAAFTARQGHHFRSHKPNRPAAFRICFLAFDSCSDSAPRVSG